jgi:hypothetical protein
MANDLHGSDGKFLSAGADRLTPEERQRRNSEQKRKKRQANREEHTRKNREWNFRRKYGITVAQYDEMRMAQEYRCAICQRHEDDLPKKPSRRTTDGLQTMGSALVVDHCHQSNKVRKLLCFKCNQGIGCFRESLEYLMAAYEYVRDVCPIDPESEGISV